MSYKQPKNHFKKMKNSRNSVSKEAPTASEMKNDQEYYSWNPTDKITITGQEFALLNNYYQIFGPLIQVRESIFNRMIAEGIATVQQAPPSSTTPPETDTSVGEAMIPNSEPNKVEMVEAESNNPTTV